MTINDGSASNQLIKSDLQKLRWWWANVQLELVETGLDLKQRAPSWPSFIYSQKIFLYSSSQKFKDAKPLLSLWVFDYNLVKYVSVKRSNSVYETIKIIVRYIFKNPTEDSCYPAAVWMYLKQIKVRCSFITCNTQQGFWSALGTGKT